jgi:hypothetical protein
MFVVVVVVVEYNIMQKNCYNFLTIENNTKKIIFLL